jgi:hypothetical protein
MVVEGAGSSDNEVPIASAMEALLEGMEGGTRRKKELTCRSNFLQG